MRYEHSLPNVKQCEMCIAFGVFGVLRVASILELQPEIWRMMDSISLPTLVISESIVNEFYFYSFPQTDWSEDLLNNIAAVKSYKPQWRWVSPQIFHFVEVVSFLIQSAAFGLMGLAPFVWPIIQQTNTNSPHCRKKCNHLWLMPASKLSCSIQTSYACNFT